MFQSRNRDAFGFKYTEAALQNARVGFQSRNRDAFGFKYRRLRSVRIERSKFQSRNRDAFGFK